MSRPGLLVYRLLAAFCLQFLPGLRVLVLALLVGWTGNVAMAGPLSSDTPRFHVHEDVTGTQTIAEIAQRPDSDFHAAPRAGFVGGYTRSVHWLKFTLKPLANQQPPLFLRVIPSYQDFLTLYLPTPAGDYRSIPSGDHIEDWQDKTDRAFVFKLPSLSEPVTAYLRLESNHTHTVVAQVYNDPAYHQALLVDFTLSGIFMGLLIILIVINLSHRKWRTDVDFRYYLLLIIASLSVFVTNSGWLPLWLDNDWKPWVDFLPQLTTLVYLLVLAKFYHVLFDFDYHTPIYSGISRIFQTLIGVGFVALLFDFYVEYMPWLMNIIMVYLLLISGFALKLTLQKRAEDGLLFIAVIFGFSGILGTVLSLGGVVSGGAWLMYSYTAGTLGSILVFQGIIGRRLRQIEQDHVTAMLEKDHAQQLTERERNEKERKAQFLSMLSHELKTPLAVIRMGVDQNPLSDRARQHVSQAISDMSQVIDRCSVLEKVDDQIPMQSEPVSLQDVLYNVISLNHESQRVDVFTQYENTVIETDEDWLKVILSNLLDNALKYSPKSTRVQVSVFPDNQAWCFRFDNLTTNDLPDPSLVFTKYYRAKSAFQQTGSGLGLYIVKRLSDQLHAQIDFEITEPSQSNYAHSNQISFRLCLPDKT